jgi:Flp pilus assembly protein TadD/uncharacterized caspase-like protein
MTRLRWLLLAFLVITALPAASAHCRDRLSKEGRRGLALLRRGDLIEARKAFQKAAAGKHHAWARELAGWGYASFRTQQYDQAAEAYERLCRLKPREWRYHVNHALALMYLDPRHLQRAEPEFRRAVELNSRDPDALHNLAVALHRDHQISKALSLATEAAKAAPRTGYIHAEVGHLYVDQGLYAEAERHLKLALSLDDRWPGTYVGLAELALHEQRYPDALDYLKQYDQLATALNDPVRLEFEARRAEQAKAAAEAGQRDHPEIQTDTEAPHIYLIQPALVPTAGQPRLPDDQGGYPELAAAGSYPVSPQDEVRHCAVLGLVTDDRAVNLITVNGAAAFFLPLSRTRVHDVVNNLMAYPPIERLKGDIIWQKPAGGDVDDSPVWHSRTYLFYAVAPLEWKSQTEIKILATDFANPPHQTESKLMVMPPNGPPVSTVRRPAAQGSLWAVCVGVNHSFPSRGWQTLLYTDNDAERLYNVLLERGGVDPEHLILMHNDMPQESERPDLKNIEAKVDDLKRRIAEKVRASGGQKSDTVLFFFSGHGGRTPDGKPYLLTRDIDPKRPLETALTREWIEQKLLSLPVRRVILFIDACHAGAVGEAPLPHAGGGAPGISPSTPPEPGPQPLSGSAYDRLLRELTVSTGEGDPGRLRLLASCRAKEGSYETPEHQEGVFCHFLLEGLDGPADAVPYGDHNGAVGLDELAKYVEDKVPHYCAGPPLLATEPQHPERLPQGWTDDFPLTFITPGQPATESTRVARATGVLGR